MGDKYSEGDKAIMFFIHMSAVFMLVVMFLFGFVLGGANLFWDLSPKSLFYVPLLPLPVFFKIIAPLAISVVGLYFSQKRYNEYINLLSTVD